MIDMVCNENVVVSLVTFILLLFMFLRTWSYFVFHKWHDIDNNYKWMSSINNENITEYRMHDAIISRNYYRLLCN
jgi:hypothetical protein